MCVCVCVCEREREKSRETERTCMKLWVSVHWGACGCGWARGGRRLGVAGCVEVGVNGCDKCAHIAKMDVYISTNSLPYGPGCTCKSESGCNFSETRSLRMR